MSQKQRTLEPDLSYRWQGLPIPLRLLIPIVLVLIAALLVVVVRTQGPINELTASAAREAFAIQSDLYQERITTFLTDQEKNLADLVNSAPVQSYAEVQTTGDQAKIAVAQSALDFYLQN